MSRTGWTAALCGLVLTVSGSAHATAQPGVEATTAVSRPHQVRAKFSIATYNIRAKLTPRRVVRDLRHLTETGVDIISLQEMGSRVRRDAVRAKILACRTCHFAAYMPEPAMEGATPILYRSWKFDLRAEGSKRVADRTFVGRAGAGPTTLPANYLNYVKLRERRTGRAVWVLNSHAVASVQDDAGRPNENYPRRLALYRHHMRVLKAMVSRLKGPHVSVFITGDLNVNYRVDRVVQARLFPYAKMRQVHVHASYEALGLPQTGTHVRGPGQDGRLIDYVYFLPRRVLTPLSQRILRGYSSDHRPVLVEFGLVGPRRRG